MTDRELLEAAAKAAGIKALRDPNGILRNCTGGHPAMNIFAAPTWNPLTDDGDALRLAVTLRALIDPQKDGVFVCINASEACASEPWGKDEAAATRRAIVLAAALCASS